MVSLSLPLVHPRFAPASSRAPMGDPGDPGTLPPLPAHLPAWPGRHVTAGGVTLHVRETPRGGPEGGPATVGADAVYVHGLSGSATNWTDIAGLLAPRVAGTAVDLPGFGYTEPVPSCDYSPAGHADALLCWLAGRGRPVHLLGNSLGGVVAMLVAARRPELVRTLTLVSPAMPDRRPDPRRMSDPRMALAWIPGLGSRARAQLAAMTPRARAEATMRLCFGDPTRATDVRLEETAEEIRARGRQPWAGRAIDRTAFGMFRSWMGPGLWRAAARVPVPTLVLWGDRDRLVAPRLAVRTARTFPDGRLVMLDGVGHIAQIETPDRVAAAVGAFWDSLGDGNMSGDGRVAARDR
ncbi:alpha/beta fold hydrolase [Pseudonocardia halophobica]|uniref:Hydrolase n=1 Tax=Pseudonocardia halophobica TaxID=29401 RepID=A0A9W6L377_9PSEU|nr:alpha/beta hydrolase [Pseudonocardia halophobica]GLL12842.1 hydrolase [Pseudonocardia halophobica]